MAPRSDVAGVDLTAATDADRHGPAAAAVAVHRRRPAGAHRPPTDAWAGPGHHRTADDEGAGPARTTRIIATLGPATVAPGVIVALVAAGMDVARLNCSHGTAGARATAARKVRAAAAHHGAQVALLFDISGPKLRVRDVASGGIALEPGDLLALTGPGGRTAGRRSLALSFDPAAIEARAGDRVLLDDGRLVARVVTGPGRALCVEVERGGVLRPGKGVCFPDSHVALPVIGAADRADLRRAALAGADAVAMSFVTAAADVEQARRLLPPGVAVVAKIERAVALRNLAEILAVSDGVMVARGDLGVELPLERLPLVQKDVIEEANACGVPVICATEMLESMTTSSRPTRAEVTDVANAVLDGADAVMLSGETANGADPVAAVATMASIVATTEASRRFRRCQPERADLLPAARHPGFLRPAASPLRHVGA